MKIFTHLRENRPRNKTVGEDWEWVICKKTRHESKAAKKFKLVLTFSSTNGTFLRRVIELGHQYLNSIKSLN